MMLSTTPRFAFVDATLHTATNAIAVGNRFVRYFPIESSNHPNTDTPDT